MTTNATVEKPTTDQPPPTSETGLAPAPRTGAVAVRMGTAPSNIDEAWRLAVNVANSTIIPKDFQGKPANVLIAIEASLEVGIPWLQGIQGSAIINGRHGFFGDLFLAILITSPVYVKHDEHYLVNGQRREDLTTEDLKKDDTKAVCTFWRKGQPEPTTRTFSIGQARRANLLGKEGPWQTYPDRQLRMRARGFAGRDCFPDVLKGMRSVEELHDTPPKADEVIEAEPIQPRRASASATPSERTPSGSAPLGTDAAQASEDASDPRSAPTGDSAAGRSPSVPNGGDFGPSMPAAPASLSSPVPPRRTHGLRITHTAFVCPKEPGSEPYYEVQAQAANGEKQMFVTRDEQLYKEALSFEGSDYRVAIEFRLRKAPQDRVVADLHSIAIDESQPTDLRAVGDGDLFK